MESFIRYVLVSAGSISIFYLGYLALHGKGYNFKFLRAFLFISMILSILLPISKFKISLELQQKQENNAEWTPALENSTPVMQETDEKSITTIPDFTRNPFKEILILLYFAGTSILLFRILTHIIFILRLYLTATKIRIAGSQVLVSEHIKSPNTFFQWIFIPMEILSNSERSDLVLHESIHASQYHSIDILIIEVLSAVLWFNPLIWMMRKSVIIVHEYLADEGVLRSGVDRLRYQTVLINHVAEERLIRFTSGFNSSLIKKRMFMITKSKFNRYSKLRILALIPLASLIFIGIACVNGNNNSSSVTAVEPVRMNVLYIGVDNPVKIASSMYPPDDLMVMVDNGRISGENGEYIINPAHPGSATVTVSVKGKKIQETVFRTKWVPDPIAKVGQRNGGDIAKNDLIKENKVNIVLENFDFDLKFNVVGFSVSAVINGTVNEVSSDSDNITPEQKELISKVNIGDPVYFQEIKAQGPDGSIRNMNIIHFRLTR